MNDRMIDTVTQDVSQQAGINHQVIPHVLAGFALPLIKIPQSSAMTFRLNVSKLCVLYYINRVLLINVTDLFLAKETSFIYPFDVGFFFLSRSS